MMRALVTSLSVVFISLGFAQAPDQTPLTDWRAGSTFKGNHPIAIPTPVVTQLPFDLELYVNPQSTIYGGYGTFGNLYGRYFIRIVTVSENENAGTGWFYGSVSSESRICVYDADGSAIAFKASNNAAVSLGIHGTLSVDGGSSTARYVLSNAGPPGSIRAKGLWVYTFDSDKRLWSIGDPSGNEEALDYGSAPDLTVTNSTSENQSLEFHWASGTSLQVKLHTSVTTTLGTISFNNSPLRVASVAWSGLPAF